MTFVRRGAQVSGGAVYTSPYAAQPDVDALDVHTQGWVNVKTHGAVGDGVTDDTAHWVAAMSTGKNIVGASGDTYLIDGGAVAAGVGQRIDMTGCTVKLKNAATNRALLTLSGTGASVRGGTWDLNRSNNTTGQDGTSAYGNFAVLLSGDRTSATGMYVKNSYGLGIKGTGDALTIANNRIEDVQYHAIYVEGSASADRLGVQVKDNTIDVSGHLGAQGVSIYSLSPYTYLQRQWSVTGNSMVGSTNASVTGVGITVRGVEGVISNNQIKGFTIGISSDAQKVQRCSIVGNRVDSPAGATAYGIEVNGSLCTVSGNSVTGGKYGITGSTQVGSGGTLDGMVVNGNVLDGQTSRGIYFKPSADSTGRRMNISGNTIIMTAAAAVQAVYLAANCQYALVGSNVLKGPGSAQANTAAVYLDGVNSDVLVQGNRLSGWERAVVAYNAAAVAQDRIAFVGNDASEDVAGLGSLSIALVGAATYGSAVQVLGNTGAASAPRIDYYDRAANLMLRISDTYTTPEANLTAGTGSIYVKKQGGAPTLFVKESGTGNTGWVGK